MYNFFGIKINGFFIRFSLPNDVSTKNMKWSKLCRVLAKWKLNWEFEVVVVCHVLDDDEERIFIIETVKNSREACKNYETAGVSD